MEDIRYSLTEFGNGDRLLARYGENIRYSKALGFFVWNGKYWQKDSDLIVRELAVDTVRHMYKEASSILQRAREENNEEKRKELSLWAEELNRWARKSESIKMACDMIEYIKGKKGILVEPSIFDTHKFLVNFNNGTFDADTGKLRPHRREDYLTVCLSRDLPSTHKGIPVYKKFYSDIFLGNEETMHMMHKALGMSLTGDTSEKCWFMLIGSGDNGKSTLMSLIQDLLEDYAGTIEPETISVSTHVPSGNTPRHDIASLRGKRFVVCSEIEDGSTLAGNLVKRMTGNDRQFAREPYARQGFEFYYTHKLFVYTNNELIVHSQGKATWKRIYRVPFNLNIPQSQLDLDLPKKLREELDGILLWLVEGLMLWRKEGMSRSQETEEATNKYRQDQDWLGELIRYQFIVDDGKSIKRSDMLKIVNAYRQEELSMKTLTAQTLRRMMEERGFTQKDEKGHGICYVGLARATSKPQQEVHTVQVTQLDTSIFEDKELEEIAKL